MVKYMKIDQDGILKIKLQVENHCPVLAVCEIDSSDEPIKMVLSDGKEKAQFHVSDWIMYPILKEIVLEGSLIQLLEYRIQGGCIDIRAYRTEDGQEFSLAPSIRSKVYTSINVLTVRNSSFRLKARVLSKSPIKYWDKASSSGKLFTITLIDRSKCEISGVFFNESVDKFYSLVEELRVYEISKVGIREAKHKFNIARNKNELVFSDRSEIRVLEDDPMIECKNYQFEALNSLERLPPNSMIDIIGIVIEVSPLLHLHSGTEDSFTKKIITLTDESKMSVEFILLNENIDHVYPGSVIAVKNAQVVSTHNLSLKYVNGVSRIEIDPQQKAAERLKQMLKDKTISKRCATPFSIRITNKNLALKPISWILQQVQIPTFSREMTTNVLGRIGYISSESFEDISYESCGLCLRKVERIDDEFVCYHCNRISYKCTYRYLLRIRIKDFSGHLLATAFEETARNILSVPVEEFQYKSKRELQMMIEFAKYKEFLFCIKSKEGDIEEGAQISHLLLSVKEVNPRIISSAIMNNIREYFEN